MLRSPFRRDLISRDVKLIFPVHRTDADNEIFVYNRGCIKSENDKIDNRARAPRLRRQWMGGDGGGALAEGGGTLHSSVMARYASRSIVIVKRVNVIYRFVCGRERGAGCEWMVNMIMDC